VGLAFSCDNCVAKKQDKGMLSNGLWICDCGKNFTSGKSFQAHARVDGCKTKRSKLSASDPATQCTAGSSENHQFFGGLGEASELPGSSAAEMEGGFPSNPVALDSQLHYAPPRPAHVTSDEMFMQLAMDNRFTNAVINQILTMGRNGLRLDQVQFTMHTHALIEAEETRSCSLTQTCAYHYFNLDRCPSRMPQRCGST